MRTAALLSMIVVTACSEAGSIVHDIPVTLEPGMAAGIAEVRDGMVIDLMQPDASVALVHDEAELTRTEPTFETPTIEAAEAVRASRPPPYRSARYVAQCRRDRWRSGEVAETVEDKSEARRQARALARSGALDELLIFSRMTYGEEGTPIPGRNDDGPAAMLAVIDSRRHSMSRIEMMVAYSPRRVFPHPGDGPRDVQQQWIAELQLDGRRPPSWPRWRGGAGYPTWRSYGCPRWLAAIDAARPVLEQYPDRVGRGPCTEQPDHWGGSMDDHRAESAGWLSVDCGNTADRFWVVPAEARLRLAFLPSTVVLGQVMAPGSPSGPFDR